MRERCGRGFVYLVEFIDRHGVGRWALNFTLILVLCFAGYWVRGQTTRAERALCTLRADVQRRHDDSQRYLDDVKAKRRKPVPGITRADIKRSMDGQRATIEALSDLNCD